MIYQKEWASFGVYNFIEVPYHFDTGHIWISKKQEAIFSGMLTIFLYLDIPVERFVLLVNVWGNNTNLLLSYFAIQGIMVCKLIWSFFFFFFNVTHDTGTWQISCCPSHGNDWVEFQFWCIFFSGCTASAQRFCYSKNPPPSLPQIALLCFVFEQWLAMQNDVCIIVCLMLTCAKRRNMEMFQ